MDFKNGVINIQTAGYNGARTVYDAFDSPDCILAKPLKNGLVAAYIFAKKCFLSTEKK